MSKGFALDTMDSIQNEGIAHFGLIRKIERITKRNLLCYIGNFPHPVGSIMKVDDRFIETAFMSIDFAQYSGNLDIMIHTLGGDALAAQNIIQTCRTYCKNLRVIIPKTAMSAGTIMAMGADSIMMRETAELGPIDPQMIVNTPTGQIQRPASSWVDAYLSLIKESQDAIKKNEPPHPFLQQLGLLDPSWIQVCLRARRLSESIAKEFLKKYMLQKKTDAEIQAVVDNFIEKGEKLSHGTAIRPLEAQGFGLNVEIIEKNTQLDKLIWELIERAERYIQYRGFAKYVICRNGGLNVKMEAVKI